MSKTQKLTTSFVLLFLMVAQTYAQKSVWQPKPNPSWLILQSMEMPAKEYPTLKLWGAIDAVFSFDRSEGLLSDNSASLKRGYVGLRGSWMENIDYFVIADFGTGVAGKSSPLLLDASVTLKHIPYAKVRIGEFKIPFGLEGLENHLTPPLINFTRASVQLMSFVAPLGIATTTRLASNSAFRDIGVQLFDQIGEENDVQVVYALALYNGTGINTIDDNSQKDIVARIEAARRGLRLGLSGLTGKEAVDRLTKRRVGLDATYYIGELHLGGEAIWGQDNLLAGGLRRAQGWHMRASYLFREHLQPVLRYEQFDPDTDVPGNTFDAIAIGFNWIFKGLTRLQANYEIRDDRINNLVGDLVTAQVQIVF